jgi:hypothetical protein
MRRFPFAALILLPALILAADPPAAPKTDKDKLSDLPGPFHPFCVSGPYISKLQQQAKEKEKIDGRFHCPVCDHGLDPMVLLFVKELTFDEPLKELLKGLDLAVQNYPNARLGVTAVFIPTDLPNVLTDDDKREEAAAKLRQLAAEIKPAADAKDAANAKQGTDAKQGADAGPGLANVTLALDSKPDLEGYKIDRNEAYPIILARGYHVLYREDIQRNQLAEKVPGLLKLVSDNFGLKKRK